MGLKVVKDFDTKFSLDTRSREILFRLLTNKTFTDRITKSLNETEIVFTDLLFKPVPYSQHTPKGMPREFEQFHNSEDYIIINVPPNFMFQAKIFQPNRLCAIYRKV